MTSLAEQRCFNHSSREAVVRCTSCRRFYCRECVSEHDGRMVCAACVSAAAPQTAAKRSQLVWIFAAAAGFLLAWLTFYYVGIGLARIPSDFFGDL